SVAKAFACVLLPDVTPEERRQLFACVSLTRPQRQVGEQGLGFARGKAKDFARRRSRSKRPEQIELDPQHRRTRGTASDNTRCATCQGSSHCRRDLASGSGSFSRGFHEPFGESADHEGAVRGTRANPHREGAEAWSSNWNR